MAHYHYWLIILCIYSKHSRFSHTRNDEQWAISNENSTYRHIWKIKVFIGYHRPSHPMYENYKTLDTYHRDFAIPIGIARFRLASFRLRFHSYVFATMDPERNPLSDDSEWTYIKREEQAKWNLIYLTNHNIRKIRSKCPVSDHKNYICFMTIDAFLFTQMRAFIV